METKSSKIVVIKQLPGNRRKIASPYRAILAYFLALTAVGMLLLILPFSSSSGQFTTPLTAFFTATSAVCVTGLVVVDTGSYWSFWGQFIIVCLMQFGGLGIAGSSMLFLFFLNQKLNLNNRLLFKIATGVSGQPVNTRILVLRILYITLGIELIGAVILFISWVGELGPLKAFWWAIFHSISAFTNGSFDLAGTPKNQFPSMTGFVNNLPVCLTLGVLIFLGGIGFVILIDIGNFFKKRKLSLQTKLVGTISLSLVGLGALFIWLIEKNNSATLGSLPVPEQLMAALFQSITPRTAGFNSINLSGLHDATMLLLVVLMFIGGSSNSMAGGLRVSTLIIVVTSIWTVVTNRKATVILKRTIPTRTVEQALALGAFHTFLIGGIVFLLALTQDIPLKLIVFEVVSAFGTVGMSLGATVELNMFGKLLIAATMFVGRVGPILLLLVIAQPLYKNSKVEYPEEEILIG